MLRFFFPVAQKHVLEQGRAIPLRIDALQVTGLREQGTAVALAYSVKHPERVSHLALYGGFAQGRLT
jgi:hypothetical protein